MEVAKEDFLKDHRIRESIKRHNECIVSISKVESSLENLAATKTVFSVLTVILLSKWKNL
jgi:hypothetical protein